MLATGVVCAAATSAWPEEIVQADPWRIVHVSRTFGPSDVARDALREPMIVGEIRDIPYQVVFYGCTLGRDCTAILFRAVLDHEARDADAPEAEAISTWNQAKLWGRAHLDDNGRAVLEHPVNLSAGLPEATLRDTFDVWGKALEEFADFVD